MIDFLANLNEAQRRAVEHPGGPFIVVAGPGTGKTRTLTCRIAYLVQVQGVDPAALAALTFTHRAAGEMAERMETLLGKEIASRIFIGTFHSLGFEIVERERAFLGFTRKPVLYDEVDQIALLREVLREMDPEGARLPVEKIKASMEKALHRNQPLAGEEGGFDLAEVWRLYGSKKQQENAVDFDDLIHLPLQLFEKLPDRLGAYRQKYCHLFVDEYQDVNDAQVKLIRLLGGGAVSVMAIGDPDQAIYSFRGSNAANFMAFSKTFPGAKILQFTDNYRSSVTILNASDQVIRGNPDRLREKAPSSASGEEGLLLDMRTLATEREEASFVARTMEALAGGVDRLGMERNPSMDLQDEEDLYGFGEMAVLYRLNAQAAGMVSALEKAGIPFQQVGTNQGGKKLHERAVLAAARLHENPEMESARRLLASITGKGKTPAPSLSVSSLSGSKDPRALLLEAGHALACAMPEEAEPFLEAAQRLARELADSPTRLLHAIHGAPLIRREDPYLARSQQVTLSTLHAAKGLEFPVVFIVGLEKGVVPYFRGDEADPAAVEQEERRLLYVGMTRAQKRLYLTRARNRFLFGRRLEGEPSPFLADISGDLVDFVREKPEARKKASRKKKDDGQRKLF